MQQFPLLDLESAWQDAHRTLREIMDRAELLWKESEYTWLDMLIVRAHALQAMGKLGDLPPGIREGIAKDQADLEEYEAHAPENVRGY